MVIIWLNGPFGVGKTATAEVMVEMLPGSRVVDPERLGAVMIRTLWRGRDYQDVSLWRIVIRWRLTRAAKRRTIVVPMTVVDASVHAALTKGANVFTLWAARSIIEDRIAASGEAQAWRMQNLERCLAALEDESLGEHVDTAHRAPSEVAATIITRLGSASSPAP